MALAMKNSGEVAVNLTAIDATSESFKEYGQVIEASPDDQEFGAHDAQLNLSRGIPRFYIMHLKGRPLGFSTITHHAKVTQCLGSIGGSEWFLGVSKPSMLDLGSQFGEALRPYTPPCVEDVQVFRVSGPKFLKLSMGTWHAGPLFKGDSMDFYNLELSNTNVEDHVTHDFKKKNGVVFLIKELNYCI